jgi:hypothetical protein
MARHADGSKPKTGREMGLANVHDAPCALVSAGIVGGEESAAGGTALSGIGLQGREPDVP